jgi:hypothetical protein
MEQISTANFHLHRDPWRRLVLTTADGQQFERIEVVRAFPISDPEHWISLCDAEGRELLCVADLNTLPEPERELIREELSRRDFVPAIRRILRLSANSAPCEWTVETDRGRTKFLLEEEEHVRPLDSERILVQDAHGIRYLIPSRQQLDPTSQRLLSRFL